MARSYTKKKKYAAHVRAEVLSGRVNDADNGAWVKSNESSASAASVRNSLAGCAGKGSRKVLP